MKRDTQALKKNLIKTGISEISEKGIDNLSIRTVAQKCGVSHGAPYRHFGSKDGYLEVLLFEISDQFSQALMQGIQPSAKAKKNLIRMGINFIDFAQTHPNLFEVLFVKFPFSYLNNLDKDLEKKMDFPGFQTFKQTIQDLKQEENLDLADKEILLHLWSFISGLAILATNQDLSPTSLTSTITSMLNTYIKGAQS